MKLKSLCLAFFIAASVGVVSAHVKVSPIEAGIATYQEFTVSVPTEKNNPTVALRLVIPGLDSVTPNVKSGWTVAVKKSATSTTEIEWSKGSIPAGFRDTFVFSAKTPSKSGQIIWKAYQTYQDGTVVAWDAGSETTSENQGPYSVTTIIDDLNQMPANLPIILSSIALLIALLALVISSRRDK